MTVTERFSLSSGYDHLKISVIAVWPEGKPHAILQVAHGMYGYKERFIPFMEYMADHGVLCVANDHRGHGSSVLSEKDLGYMYAGGWAALVEDMHLVSSWALRTCPDTPLYLLGHSMGSMAARVYAKKYDGLLSGLIICGSPAKSPFADLGWAMTKMICMAGGERLRPRMIQKMTSDFYNRRFADEGPGAWTCSDAKIRKSYSDNPLSHFRFTVNAQSALLGLMREAYSTKGWEMTNKDMPVLFISGEDDPCMGSERIFHHGAIMMNSLGYRNVTSAIYPSMRHEILNEIGKEMVWDDVLKFVRGTVR